jgi:Flp pilus assembly protein TadB
MMLAVAALLFAAALITSGAGRFAGPLGTRLDHLVPARAALSSGLAGEVRYQRLVLRAFAMIDPTFPLMETRLRSLGVSWLAWIILIEIGKLGGAILIAMFAAALVPAMFPGNVAMLATVPFGFFLFILAVNNSIKEAALRRRKRIRRELTLGIEILCIFLEGGQSLDQAFRSFSDVCGDALPHIAGIQRALITDLNNGVPYEKAIDNWVQNLHVDEAKALATLFVDSLVHGTELVPHLRQFSLELVEQRIANARASIGVKSSQLTVVMVLFFLPAILAFITAPAITGVLTTLETSR